MKSLKEYNDLQKCMCKEIDEEIKEYEELIVSLDQKNVYNNT